MSDKKYVPFLSGDDPRDKVYTFIGGPTEREFHFTNAEAAHAVNDFHHIIEVGREYDVPYNLGIMGGCLAHACKWSDEVVEELEGGNPGQFFSILARLVSAYYSARSVGIFDSQNARQS